MLRDVAVAQYLLSKDADRNLFNKKLIQRNGREFYEGNARLNKYLHLAQNIYIAKTGGKLFAEDLYAYANGAVAPAVQENYAILWSRSDVPDLPPEARGFLDKIYRVLENADIDELIELSHEDSEWTEKSRFYKRTDQRMDSLAHTEEYKEQYGDILRVMDRMKP